MYLASRVIQKNTQDASELLAATPLSIFHSQPIEMTLVVAVELHSCMRHGARRNFKATSQFQQRLHLRKL
jgi:hypothetical protein